MVETADKLKVKKDYNKIGTEDDPIIIAQRFLNILTSQLLESVTLHSPCTCGG